MTTAPSVRKARALSRRRLLAVAGGVALAHPALAQQEIGPRPHPKGPRVFLDYDQVELDAAYDQRAYAPNLQQVTARYASNSVRTRERIGAPERETYGESAIEALDIYRRGRNTHQS